MDPHATAASAADQAPGAEAAPPVANRSSFPLSTRYLATARSVLEFQYTHVTAACLRYVGCTSVSDAVVVFSQPSMRCDSAEWRSTLVLVVIVSVLYVFGWPVVSLLVGWRQRASASWLELDAFGAREAGARSPRPSPWIWRLMDSTSNSAFVSRSWFWAAMILLRRVCILLIDSLTATAFATRVQLFSLVHLVALLLQLWQRPFAEARLNALESVSLLLLLVSLVLGASSVPSSVSLTVTQQVLLCFLVLPALIGFCALAVRQMWVGQAATKRDEVETERGTHEQPSEDRFKQLQVPLMDR